MRWVHSLQYPAADTGGISDLYHLQVTSCSKPAQRQTAKAMLQHLPQALQTAQARLHQPWILPNQVRPGLFIFSALLHGFQAHLPCLQIFRTHPLLDVVECEEDSDNCEPHEQETTVCYQVRH
jgi:hypothetical protein